MICPNCNKEIDDNAVFCRFCGETLDEEKGREIEWQKMYKEEKRQKIKKGVIISFVCLGLSLYVYLLFHSDDLFRDDTSCYSEELDAEDIYDEEDSEDSYVDDVDDYSSEDSYENSYDADYNTQTYEEYYGITEDNETDGEVQYRTGNNGDVYEDSGTRAFKSVWDYFHRNQ